MNLGPVLFIVVAVLVVGTIGYLGYLAEKKRREAFAALVAAHGWSYAEHDDRWTRAWAGPPFGLGHRPSARNVVSGAFDSRQFVAFDYRYYTTETSTDAQGRTTRREVSHDYGVVAMDLAVAVPRLEVSPEGWFTRMVGRLLDQDIELESEDFNRAFTVTCPDRKFASDVLHPRMMEFLLGHRETAFRFEGTWVLTAEPGRVPVESIEPRLRLLDGVLDRVPEFVWRDLRGQ